MRVMTMTSSKINPHILRYIEMVESGEINSCEDQKLLVAYVRKCFETEDIHVNSKQLEKYLALAKYFPFEKIFEWQEFVIALHDCTYKSDGMPRWPDLFCLIGRGAGKDGTIALESVCLMSPYNGIQNYDVDICANNEDQAMRPLKDVIEAFENPANIEKLKKHFYWTKEAVQSRKTRSILKGRTNSPKGKDGLRSGIVIFNEIHQYENYSNVNVFTTGLGKKAHPRRSYYTTNGDVRDGVLDDMLNTAEGILYNGDPDNGMLPFICRLDSKEEVDDPDNWEKANPSLRYLPSLRHEIEKEYQEWKRSPHTLTAFMTKRMNLPQTFSEVSVTSYDNLKATESSLPDLTGKQCVVGIDYASVTDWAAVRFHFRNGNKRYSFGHAWMCLQSKDLERIKAPWRKWAEEGRLTLVDEPTINPDLLAEYIQQQAKKYQVKKIAMDNNRYALLSNSLKKIGFDGRNKDQVKLVRPSDIYKVFPVIENAFENQYFVFGDDPIMRWAINNTKVMRGSRTIGSDTGNFYYAKIEAKSRKNDPWMAEVAAMTVEDELPENSAAGLPSIPIMVW
ncbi:terminase large subunit [Ruminococcaceae bacterium OttesenSCG-928-A16]|nr:terminase large subunit [Ruminococcaceae bacterium OttesenSCG-928-A16]